MGDLPGGVVNSVALAISGDGQVVVGTAPMRRATVLWCGGRAQGLTVLPDLPGAAGFGLAFAASNDGRFIAGYSHSAVGYEAVLWKDYGTVAVGLGDLPGGQASSVAVLGLTDDASMIVGYSDSAAGERLHVGCRARDARQVVLPDRLRPQPYGVDDRPLSTRSRRTGRC